VRFDVQANGGAEVTHDPVQAARDQPVIAVRNLHPLARWSDHLAVPHHRPSQLLHIHSKFGQAVAYELECVARVAQLRLQIIDEHP
jgi:hypothetical protein